MSSFSTSSKANHHSFCQMLDNKEDQCSRPFHLSSGTTTILATNMTKSSVCSSRSQATNNKKLQNLYSVNRFLLLISASSLFLILVLQYQIRTADAQWLGGDSRNQVDLSEDDRDLDRYRQNQQPNNGHNVRKANMQQHPKALLQQPQHNQHQNNINGQQTQNRCQSGWMWFNNKCWVTTQSRRDFSHAIELCKKTYNSTLPTIHSEDENEFLRQNIDLHNSPIWLYARHNHQYNKTQWLDRTPVNYTRWDAGQPSDKSSLVCIKTEESWYMKKAEPVDGQTECVSFWEDAKWGTQVGCLVLLPVVCERKLTPISRYSDGSNGTIIAQNDPLSMNQYSAAGSNHYPQTITIYVLLSLTILLFNQINFTRKLYSIT